MNRRIQGVSDGLADPLWALGAAVTPPKQRPSAQAALHAAAALRAGGQDRAPATPGSGETPYGVRHPDVLQLLLTSRQSMPSTAAARADQWDGLGPAVAALYATAGRGADRTRVDPT